MYSVGRFYSKEGAGGAVCEYKW